jgi:NAD(P)-dependent dehydrogenase (short-subunit alcohol dehydrogenase family)
MLMTNPSNETAFRLDGRIALVTGAARGIGRASAVALAGAGADIIGLDIAAVASSTMDFEPASPADLAETGRQVAGLGRRWTQEIVDQRDMPALRAAIRRAVAHFGGLDIVHANAGIQGFKALIDMEDADWRDQIDVNLTGTANVIRVVAPYLVERGGGRIIVTSSTQGQHGTLHGSAYSASKWGLIGLMKSAALELGKHKITVNALIPGLIDTHLTRHEDRYAQALEVAGKRPTGRTQDDETAARAGLALKSPLGQPWIAPEEVAPAIVFLASDAARMVSGTSLAVTAGDSANITA